MISLKMLKTVLGSLMLMGAALCLSVSSSAAQEGPHTLISDSAKKVLNLLENIRSDAALPSPEKTAHFEVSLLDVLESIVDFPSISKAVMNKHYNAATPEQRAQFSVVFKKTLAQLYAKSLVKLEIEHIEVLPPEDAKKSSRVIMKAFTASGEHYSIVYSMKKGDDDQWRVRNVILDGINLGLTYRNQFESATTRHQGNIQKVIQHWSNEMDT